MITIRLRFYGQLNDLLAPARRAGEFTRILHETTTVRDLIEGCGVPHTEVDLILRNGHPVHLDAPVGDGERFSIYPAFLSLAIPDSLRLQPRLPEKPRFLADVHLGRLTRYMRLAGFDTAYRNDATDPELVAQMQAETRVLLSRDRRLLMRRSVDRGCLLRSDHAVRQLEEILQRFDLQEFTEPFSRCTHCNQRLQSVDKNAIRDRLEPLTEQHYHSFSLCPGCDRIYWRGSHHQRMHPDLRRILFHSN